MEFHKRFDALTNLFLPGVLVPIRVHKKLRAAEFSLSVRPFSIPFLLKLVLFPNLSTRANAFLLFDAIRLRAHILHLPLQIVARMFFSTLLSFNIFRIDFTHVSTLSALST
eukprot:TRINITY_DN1834_c0_g2_i3.p2 TRINITY_DN1834_c0_g2~~TRINITY_DN1834_c0_g2_i3.p2  ORF type:complete len:111 (+),score=8.74 TRINITY_DN1834_c0_g2_i3:79-411(+)